MRELEYFAECCLSETKLPYWLETAVKGLEIAEALEESLRTGWKIVWDEYGRIDDRWSGQNDLDCGDGGEFGKTSEKVVVNGFENVM